MSNRARLVVVICAAVVGLAACATSGNVSQAPDRPEPRYDNTMR